jgi:hypothetical protein
MKEERKLHNEEIENQGYFEKLVEEFQVNSILPDDGVVEPEGYKTFANDQSGTEEKIRVVGGKRGPESLDRQCLALSG